MYSQLNSKILLDFDGESVKKPGEVFIYNGSNQKYISDKKNKKDIPLVIELSPPCDFANKKGANPKIVSGFLTKYSPGRLKQLSSMAIYTESYPLYILGNETFEEGVYLMAFDFRYVNNILKSELDGEKFKYLFTVKDKLFADILQKMSSYTARLGLSIIR